MMPTVPSAIPDTLFAFTLVLLLLSPLSIAGVALLNTGLGRSRSAAQALLGNLAILAVTAIIFAVFGAALAGCPLKQFKLRIPDLRQTMELARSRSALSPQPVLGQFSIATRTALRVSCRGICCAPSLGIGSGSLASCCWLRRRGPNGSLCLPSRSTLGVGMVAGLRSSASTSRSGLDFLMSAAQAAFTCSAE